MPPGTTGATNVALTASASAQVGEVVLRVSGVGKAFHRGIWPMRRSVQVLSGATLEVRPGELVGLVGENGSGPQLAMLWDKLTVDEHFELFARAYGMDAAARRLEDLPGLIDATAGTQIRADGPDVELRGPSS